MTSPTKKLKLYLEIPAHARPGNVIEEIIRLVEEGADPNIRFGKYQITPLMLAASSGTPEDIAFLLSSGADPEIKNNFGTTALDVAKNRNETYSGSPRDYDILDLLENAVNEDPDSYSFGSFNTYLMEASAVGDLNRLLIYLYKTGVNDINAQNSEGDTALHYAVMNNHPEIIRELLLNRADSKIKNDDGLTPYDLALEFDDNEILNLFHTH